MKSRIALAVALGCVAATAAAQQPSSAFDRGNSQQSWQNPGLAAVLAKCSNKPQPFRISGDGDASTARSPPPPPALPTPAAIPGVIAANQSWKVVWAWEGNNADGPIAGDGRQDPVREPGREQRHGARSRDRPREGHPRQHQHRRRVVAQQERRAVRRVARLGRRRSCSSSRSARCSRTRSAASRSIASAAWRTTSRPTAAAASTSPISGGGLFYANPQGVMTKYGDGVAAANGIILSADEHTLYVTNGPALVAFDVQAGRLADQPARVRQAAQRPRRRRLGHRLRRAAYMSPRAASADVFAPNGEFLGRIDGPEGMHGVAFGGKRQEDAVRHRLLRRLGHAERAQPGRRRFR